MFINESLVSSICSQNNQTKNTLLYRGEFVGNAMLFYWLGRGFLLQTFDTDINEGENAESDIQTMRQLLDENNNREEQS